MAKLRYWSKVELELDTETGKIRIIKGFHQPSAGLGSKKPKTKKVMATATMGEVEF